MTARWSGEWGRPPEPPESSGSGSAADPSAEPVGLEVLIPTYGRHAELAVTLSGLAAQVEVDFDVVISDQSEVPTWEEPTVRSMVTVLRAQGRRVRLERHLPRRGLAEQRDFLLGLATAPRVLYLDNDVWLEPGMLARMQQALDECGCGFVGAAVQGLSYLDDPRPDEQQSFEPWEGRPEPELVEPDSPEFERWQLHNAANLAHIAADRDIPRGGWLLYRVAWVGGCVLFDREALVEVGGFSFWDRLPAEHAGEDAVAQARVMAAYGGAGLLPSGAVHLEAPTTVEDRSTEVRDVVPTDPSVPV